MASGIPLFRSLDVCTRHAKANARVELGWFVGFAMIPLFIVLIAIVFSRPFSEAPRAIFEVVGRGEMMIYATSVCGATLYSLRHSLSDTLPEVIRLRATPLGTLATMSWLCLLVAICAYLVRRLGELNGFRVNDGILTWSSMFVLIFAVLIAYITFSLKHSLNSGATIASREQTEDFAKEWDRERDA